MIDIVCEGLWSCWGFLVCLCLVGVEVVLHVGL